MHRKYIRVFVAAATALSATLAGVSATAQQPHETHGADEGHAAHADHGADAALAHQPGAQLGQRTLCPIMGGEFEITADSPQAEHEGQTVYFCCPGCIAEFEADPAGSLAGLAAKIDAANAEAAAQ